MIYQAKEGSLFLSSGAKAIGSTAAVVLKGKKKLFQTVKEKIKYELGVS
jgi:hypothetical protein